MGDAWIVFKRHERYGQRDEVVGPPTFDNIVVFDDEVSALRYAVDKGLKCQEIVFGEPLYKPPVRQGR